MTVLVLLAFQLAEPAAAAPPLDRLPSEEAVALLREGSRAYSKKRYERAEKIARQILEQTDEQELRFAAQNLLGVALLDQREGEKATEAAAIFRALIDESEGRFLQSFYNLAAALRQLQAEEEGLALLRELLAKQPSQELADQSRILLCELKSSIGASDAPGGEELPADLPEVTPPVKLWAPPPLLSPEDRADGVRGKLILQAVVDREGCVGEVKVLQGLAPRTDHLAHQKLRSWTFRPALRNGESVSVYYNLTMTFRVE